MKVSILGEQACEAASLIPLSALHSQQPHRPRATCTEPTRVRPAGTQPVPFPTWAPGPRRPGERPCSRTSSRGRAGLRPIRKPEAPPSARPSSGQGARPQAWSHGQALQSVEIRAEKSASPAVATGTPGAASRTPAGGTELPGPGGPGYRTRPASGPGAGNCADH